MEIVMAPDDEREAWLAEMIRLHERPLLHLCFLELRDRQLAEDAVQETYLKAFRRYDTLKSYQNMKAWLSKVAVNTCRDMRRSGWFRHHDRRVTPDMLPEAGEEFTARDESVTLAVLSLPEKLREVVLLRCVQGMSQAEIAKALGLSPPAVSARMERVRKKLRAALEGGDFLA